MGHLDNNFEIIRETSEVRIVERNFSLLSGLTSISKSLTSCLMHNRVDPHVRFELENAFAITDNLINNEREEFKPTTVRLKNMINEELQRNKHGDGVIVRVVNKREFKIEKCTLTNFYIHG